MRGEKEKEKNIVKVRDEKEKEGGKKLSKEMISEREVKEKNIVRVRDKKEREGGKLSK